MPLSKREQDAIMVADLHRRHQRQLLEDAALGIDVDNQQSDAFKIAHAKKHSHVNACLVRSIGVVCPPPKTSASRNSWDRGMACTTTKGVAPGSLDPTPSMAVYKDGIRTIVPISNTRPTRAARAAKTSTATAIPEAARIHLQHNFADE